MPAGKIKIVKKPWGREVWFAQAPRYVGKILEIKRGHRLSRQYHKKKHETVFVQKGRLYVELGSRKAIKKAGTAFVVPPRTIHRFEARYGDVALVEVSTPEVWDIVRLADDYGRTAGE